ACPAPSLGEFGPEGRRLLWSATPEFDNWQKWHVAPLRLNGQSFVETRHDTVTGLRWRGPHPILFHPCGWSRFVEPPHHGPPVLGSWLRGGLSCPLGGGEPVARNSRVTGGFPRTDSSPAS